MCFVLRIISSLGCSVVVTTCLVVITSNFRQHIAELSGLMEAIFGLGYMLGPAVGGSLYEVPSDVKSVFLNTKNK